MPTDLNRRIAEAKGWTEIEPGLDGSRCGREPAFGDRQFIPDYTGDPREWGKLGKEMVGNPQAMQVLAQTSMDTDDFGDAVCLAWLAVNEAEEGGR